MTGATSNLIKYGKIDSEGKIAFGATAQVELCDFGAASSYTSILSCAELNFPLLRHRRQGARCVVVVVVTVKYLSIGGVRSLCAL